MLQQPEETHTISESPRKMGRTRILWKMHLGQSSFTFPPLCLKCHYYEESLGTSRCSHTGLSPGLTGKDSHPFVLRTARVSSVSWLVPDVAHTKQHESCQLPPPLIFFKKPCINQLHTWTCACSRKGDKDGYVLDVICKKL